MTDPRNRVEAKSDDHFCRVVTGPPIEVNTLNYWSAELQEVYATPQDMLTCLRDLNHD